MDNGKFTALTLLETKAKRAFSVAAPRVWNELPITDIYSKLHFHHKSSVVPRSDNDFCASLFTIMLNDSVLLPLRAQVPDNIDAIEVNYFYYA